jgi:HD-like signal output (HDOD) protein
MEPLWVHSLAVATGSRWLAQRLGLSKFIDESFLAGLLHDIGKLLLLKIIEDLENTGSINENISDSVIRDVFETLHCGQGYRLMKHLNMPEAYCNIVLKHNDEDISDGNILLNIVKLANLTCHKLEIGLKHDPGIMLSATKEAINLMASDLVMAELQVELEDQIVVFQNMLKL